MFLSLFIISSTDDNVFSDRVILSKLLLALTNATEMLYISQRMYSITYLADIS